MSGAGAGHTRLRSNAIIRLADAFRPCNAGKEVLLFVRDGQARGARDHWNGGLGSDILAEDRSALFACEAYHSWLDRRPFVEVGLVLDGRGVGSRDPGQLGGVQLVFEIGEFVRIDERIHNNFTNARNGLIPLNLGAS